MFFLIRGAGRSSEVERSLIVRWVVGSILHGVDPLSYFSFQQVLHDWRNKGRGMCYPLCGIVHIKEPLLLIDKSSLCGGSGFPFSLSEWSLTTCLTPYNHRENVLSASLNKTFLSLSPSFVIFNSLMCYYVSSRHSSKLYSRYVHLFADYTTDINRPEMVMVDPIQSVAGQPVQDRFIRIQVL